MKTNDDLLRKLTRSRKKFQETESSHLPEKITRRGDGRTERSEGMGWKNCHKRRWSDNGEKRKNGQVEELDGLSEEGVNFSVASNRN